MSPAAGLALDLSSGVPEAAPRPAANRRDPAPRIADTEIPPARIILSFDVEEHYRIEAAAGLSIDNGLKTHYDGRLDISTRWLLDRLAERDIKATFFVVGQVARQNPGLIRDIHHAGHEVACHGWEHHRVHHFNRASFKEDVLRCKDELEQVVGEEVIGFRAPTFSIMQQTGWAIDVLAEAGIQYDSSIFPVRHDRYGVPYAPRVPFIAQGAEHFLLEFPPATLRLFGTNLPCGGGGYFRLLPLMLMKMAIRQLHSCESRVATLYFHPWEFDPAQARLPLAQMNGFRTYVGLGSSRRKLGSLLNKRRFSRACDVAASLRKRANSLPCLALTI